MNWKRGLIRLWLIVSLLWLVVAIGVALIAVSKQEKQIIEPNRTEIPECTNKSFEDCFSEWKGFQEIKHVTVWQVPPWWVFLSIAAVPVLLFVIGLALWWAVQGFGTTK